MRMSSLCRLEGLPARLGLLGRYDLKAAVDEII